MVAALLTDYKTEDDPENDNDRPTALALENRYENRFENNEIRRLVRFREKFSINTDQLGEIQIRDESDGNGFPDLTERRVHHVDVGMVDECQAHQGLSLPAIINAHS